MTNEEREKAIKVFEKAIKCKEIRENTQGCKGYCKTCENHFTIAEIDLIKIYNVAIEALSEDSKLDKVLERCEKHIVELTVHRCKSKYISANTLKYVIENVKNGVD